MLNKIKNIIRIETDKTERKTTYMVSKKDKELLHYALSQVDKDNTTEVVWEYIPYYESWVAMVDLTIKQRMKVLKLIRYYHYGVCDISVMDNCGECMVSVGEICDLTV